MQILKEQPIVRKSMYSRFFEISAACPQCVQFTLREPLMITLVTKTLVNSPRKLSIFNLEVDSLQAPSTGCATGHRIIILKKMSMF